MGGGIESKAEDTTQTKKRVNSFTLEEKRRWKIILITLIIKLTLKKFGPNIKKLTNSIVFAKKVKIGDPMSSSIVANDAGSPFCVKEKVYW